MSQGSTAPHYSGRWVILAGSFVIMFLEVGTLKAYGVLVDDISSGLRTSTGLVGLAIGFAQGLTFLLGKMYFSVGNSRYIFGKNTIHN